MKITIRKQRKIYIFLLATAISLQQCGGSGGVSKTKEIKTASGTAMILIPGGEFTMGSHSGNADEAPAHKVFVSGFAMDKYEVQQENYENFMLAAPSHFKGPNNPVEQVRWSDAAKYCNARSREEKLQPCYDEITYECRFEANGYRLPTEAEWEYACRAGSNADYDFGGDPQKLSKYGWFEENSNKKTGRSGMKKPNNWGLCDMYGNVMEWCQDVYDENYYKNSPERDPRGPADGDKRILRGGAWNSSANACRAASRMADAPGIADACFARDAYGFRCVRRLTEEELAALK
ncbi:MAG: formylglycine-generating enzyme family protein [Candidatus Omnitrophota bacterium]